MLDVQTAPTGTHRQNPAERAVQTFKSHFMSAIDSSDTGHPIDAWDCLLLQTNVTLNMLQTRGVNGVHSAHLHVHKVFNCDAHPSAPSGCQSIVHNKNIRARGKRLNRGNKDRQGTTWAKQ